MAPAPFSSSPSSVVPAPVASPFIPAVNGRSFAEVLSSSMKPPSVPGAVHEPALMDGGEPAVFFSADEISASLKPFDFSLVARTPYGRPAFPMIRAHLSQRCAFREDFIISALDTRHLLLRFRNHEDYLKLLLKESLFVHGRLFRFFKWTMSFSPLEDSPILPVWISLPGLPVNLFVEPMLRSIAGNIGGVLKIDPSSLNLTNTVAARVCVELDITKVLPHRLWIGIPGGGIWQDISYPVLPKYCLGCSRLGHCSDECKGKMSQAHPVKVPSKGDTRPAQNSKYIWKPVVNASDEAPSDLAQVETRQPAHGGAGIDLSLSIQNSSLMAGALLKRTNPNTGIGNDIQSNNPTPQGLGINPVVMELPSQHIWNSDKSVSGLSNGPPPVSSVDPLPLELPSNQILSAQAPGLAPVAPGGFRALEDSDDTNTCDVQIKNSVALESVREEIVKAVSIENVRVLSHNCPRVITRSMRRSGSEGQLHLSNSQ